VQYSHKTILMREKCSYAILQTLLNCALSSFTLLTQIMEAILIVGLFICPRAFI